MTEEVAIVEVARSKLSTKFELDNRLSINTVIACLTILGAVLAITDRIAASAASTAVIQQKQTATDAVITQFLAQRTLDRQELLAELRYIKEELRDSALATRRK